MTAQRPSLWPILTVPSLCGLVVLLVLAARYGVPTAEAADPARSAAADESDAGARAPVELVRARRFRLERPYRHNWRADRPLVDRGWLLVLGVPGERTTPSQLREPVLQVGERTAERINTGQGSGKLVVLVPGDAELSESPIFFGPPALPERLRPRDLVARAEAARSRGVEPPSPSAVAAVRVEPALVVADADALRRAAIDLVATFAPGERELIEGWRLPRVK